VSDETKTDGREDKLRLGGMALANGLLLHGPRAWSIAVRDTSGLVRVATGRKVRLGGDGVSRFPLLRGVVRLGEGLLVVPAARRALPQARLPFEDRMMVASTAGVSVLALALRRSNRVGPLATEAITNGLSAVPALLALRSKKLASYHGAEHKTIGAYEHGTASVDATKEHERCGSHLVAPLLIANTALGALAERLPVRHRKAGRAAAQLLATGVAVEAFAYAQRRPGSRVARVLQAPGFAIQAGVGTREPSADQLAVASAALDALLAAERRS
jgi:uncharacterized protein YqhQ